MPGSEVAIVWNIYLNLHWELGWLKRFMDVQKVHEGTTLRGTQHVASVPEKKRHSRALQSVPTTAPSADQWRHTTPLFPPHVPEGSPNGGIGTASDRPNQRGANPL